jgi:hypothetical protein
VPTLLSNWITLEKVTDDGGEALEQDGQLLKMGGKYYSLRSLAPYARHLPLSLTTIMHAELGGRLREIQQVVLALHMALSKLTISLAGGVGISFANCSVSAAIVLLRSFSTGTPLLKSTILELPCAVTLSVRSPPRAVQDYGQFNQMHAFALWRKHFEHRAEGAVFLGPASGKSTGLHATKLKKEFKEEFLGQFAGSPPTDIGLLADWEDFKEELRTSTSKLPTTFHDNWLEHNLRRHHWLGRVWRTKVKDSSTILSPIHGAMTLHEVTDLDENAQILIEANSAKAAPFFFPKVPTSEQEKVFSAVQLACDRALKGLVINLKDLHEADPLGLKFPATINT